MNNSTEIAFVTVPHQMPAKVYIFGSEEEALEQLVNHHVNRGWNWEEHTPESWESRIADMYGDDWRADEEAVASYKRGADLFAAGATRIVDRQLGETDESELLPIEKAGTELAYAIEGATYDFHTHYWLSRAEAVEILEKDLAYGSHHQRDRWMSALREEALSWGWIEEASDDDEETEA